MDNWISAPGRDCQGYWESILIAIFLLLSSYAFKRQGAGLEVKIIKVQFSLSRLTMIVINLAHELPKWCVWMLNYFAFSGCLHSASCCIGCCCLRYLFIYLYYIYLLYIYLKHLNIEKIAFKFVQTKFLEMHVTNRKLCFDIFKLGYLQNIFMENDLYRIF